MYPVEINHSLLCWVACRSDFLMVFAEKVLGEHRHKFYEMQLLCLNFQHYFLLYTDFINALKHKTLR